MLGSQILDTNLTYNGRDFQAGEVRAFGYSKFGRAVSTSDKWTSHDGPVFITLLRGEACWDCGPDVMLRAVGGQAVLLPGGMLHRVADGIYPPCGVLWFVLNHQDQAVDTGLFADDERQHFYEALPATPVRRELSPDFVSAAEQFARAIQNPSARSGSRLVMADLRSRLYSILVGIWRAVEAHDGDSHQSRLVMEAAALLRGGATDGVAVAEVAEQLGYSRGYLHAAFRREMGMSPSDYQRRLRLRLCSEQLVASRESVTEIAHSLGFSSSQHLSKVFRTYYGMTPSDYRKQHQGAAPGSLV